MLLLLWTFNGKLRITSKCNFRTQKTTVSDKPHTPPFLPERFDGEEEHKNEVDMFQNSQGI